MQLPEPPHRTALRGVTPNPLSTASPGRIGFTLAREGPVLLEIHDLQGRLVRTVFDDLAGEGDNEAVWNGTNASGTPVASGVYFLRLRAGGEEQSARVVVVKGGR